MRESPEDRREAVVLACGHCGIPSRWMQRGMGPGVVVAWRAALCHEGRRALPSPIPPGASLVVLGGRDLDAQAFLAEEFRQAGVDPLRIRFLDAWRFFSSQDAVEAHVRAAVARLRGMDDLGSGPARATRAFRGHLSRRSFLSPLPRFLAPVPRIDASACRANRGCDLCVRACPAGALGRGFPPSLVSAACTSCGVCVPACPTGAIAHPSLAFPPILEEARALADAPGLSLLVACTGALLAAGASGMELDPGRWRLLEVPATGGLRAVDVLRLRSAGFARVVELRAGPCCPEGARPFAVAAALLRRLGYEGLVVSWDLSAGVPSTAPSSSPPESVELPAADTLPAFAARLAPEGGSIDLPGRGAGVVAVDPARCTACGLCADRCWSGALDISDTAPGSLRLSFDGQLCDGCGLCADVCPEDALELRRAVRPGDGRRVLKEDDWVSCARCGKRVAPRAMLDRVAGRIPRAPRLDLCPDCKPVRLLAT